MPGGRDAWVDLAELPQAGSKQASVELGGEALSIEALKDKLNFWHTTRCSFNFILADKLRAPEADGLRMKRLQDLRKEKPDWIVSRMITLKGALRGEFTDECLALSYRWASPEDPDPDGWQLDELRSTCARSRP